MPSPLAQDSDAQNEPHVTEVGGGGWGGGDGAVRNLSLDSRKLTWSHRRGWWRRSQRCWRHLWSPHLRRRSGPSWHCGGEGEPAVSPLGPLQLSLSPSHMHPASQQRPAFSLPSFLPPHLQWSPLSACPLSTLPDFKVQGVKKAFPDHPPLVVVYARTVAVIKRYR